MSRAAARAVCTAFMVTVAEYGVLEEVRTALRAESNQPFKGIIRV